MKAPAHGQRAGVRSVIFPDRLTSRPTREMKWLRKLLAMIMDSRGVMVLSRSLAIARHAECCLVTRAVEGRGVI